MTTVIVPHYNRRDLLVRLLEALRTQTAPHRVLVVDNGSADDSVAVAREAGAAVLPLGRNYGFAYAVNRGIEAAQTETVAIVNNDVVPRADWLERLLAAEAPYACGLLLREQDPETIDGAFDLVSTGGLAWRGGAGQRAEDAVWRQARDIQLAPLTAALFRRAVFARVGLLDERFGSYLEDVDFGIRCGAAGLRGRYVPEAVATHRGSATLGAWHADTVRLLSRNQMLLIAKYYPRRWVWPLACSAVVGQLLWGMAAARHGQAAAWWQGKRDGLRQWREWRQSPAEGIAQIRASHTELRAMAKGGFWKVATWCN